MQKWSKSFFFAFWCMMQGLKYMPLYISCSHGGIPTQLFCKNQMCNYLLLCWSVYTSSQRKKKKKTLQIIFVSFLIYRKRIWKNWNEFHILITNIIAIWHKLKKICYIDVWRTFLDSFIVSLRKALKVGRLSELNI